ncbi:MAG: XRE family transcriptional regulator [Pseudonocardiaceae bacterium]
MDVASRRDMLQEFTTLSGTVLVQPVRRWLAQALAAVPLVSPESVSSDDLDALERTLMIFRRWDASGMGGLHRKAVVGQLNGVAETLREPHSPAVHQRLFQITAELAQAAGWMAYDQGLPGVAQRYYLLGLSACHEARSPALGAKILGDMARLSTKYGHYEDSLDLVHAALYSLPHHDSALVRAELLGVESLAHAHLRGHAQVTRASDACVEVWQDAQVDVVPDWQHYMGQAQVDGLAADAYIELAIHTEDSGRAIAHARRAERHTLSARESRTPGFDRSRILDEIRLANVRLAQHDVAESVTVAQAALELAVPTSSTLVCDRLLGFHGELTAQYPDNVHVIPFREQLREYVKRVAPQKKRDSALI